MSYKSVFVFSSEDRNAGQTPATFISSSSPSQTDMHTLTPVGFDAVFSVNNCNTSNNTFVVNGVTVTVPAVHYPDIAAFMAALKLALDTALATVFTITNVSLFPNTYQLNVACLINYTVTSVTPQFTRLTGITATTVAALTNTFGLTRLGATDYFDVTSSNIGTGEADFVSSGTTNGLIFRVPFNPLSMTINYDAIHMQVAEKKIYHMLAQRYPYISWNVVDEWGQSMQFNAGSRWWVKLSAEYRVQGAMQ